MQHKTPSTFQVNELYSVEQIQTALGVGNAGGIRVCTTPDGEVRRAVILTAMPSAKQLAENPYHDRIENDVLVYTGAGREGEQTLAGVNKRIPQQFDTPFPTYGFILIGSRRDPAIGPNRWRFLGLLEYLRHYPDTQVDSRNVSRRVWMFELRVHAEPKNVSVEGDYTISSLLLAESRQRNKDASYEDEVVTTSDSSVSASDRVDPMVIEGVRGRLLAAKPETFEHIVKRAMIASGFHGVSVTRFSQDGGIDVVGRAGPSMWPMLDLVVQVQAKRWLHTVGRKEVAELRGSLEPFASGAIVTTSHYSRAAINEARMPGRSPIVLIDGHSFAKILLLAGVHPE